MSPNGELPPVEEGHPDTRPYLTIPYWSNAVAGGSTWDTGLDRPLPGSVISYLCDSIHTSAFAPGQPLEVVVDVRNSGGGSSSAVATVVVYWADPSAGFAKPKFFAASSVPVPPTRSSPGVTQTPMMRATIPATAPAHICLLVRVSHPQDPAGTAADPVGDRHWAQRNLVAATVAPGAPGLLSFVIANPLTTAGGFMLLAGPADERHLAGVARAVDREATQLDATLLLLDEGGADISDRGVSVGVSLELAGLEQRRLQLLIDVASAVSQGRVAVVEIRLLDAGGDRLVGSLGIALTSD
jgi:hypothetical protein